MDESDETDELRCEVEELKRRVKKLEKQDDDDDGSWEYDDLTLPGASWFGGP